MGRTSDKLAAEMEDKDKDKSKDWQNAIETAGICEAEDARDCANTNITIARHRSPRLAEKAHPAGASALRFDNRCRQRQAQRRICLEGDKENRMREKLPRMRFCLINPQCGDRFSPRLRSTPYAHDLETAVSRSGADVP